MSTKRLGAVAVLMAVVGIAVVARSAQVSVFEHDFWVARALVQQEEVIEIAGPRGTIRSGDGYLLAASIRCWAAQVDTWHLEYPSLFAAAAAPILGEGVETVKQRLAGGARYLWLAKSLDLETAKELQTLERDAIGLVPHWDRQYPLGPTAAPVVGFVGREELLLEGRSGLESYYETLLVGEPDRCVFVEDAHGRQLRLERIQSGRQGYDLELTIHARVQHAAESELAAAIAAVGADAGSVVVLEADTGNLLALASYPFSDRPTANVPYDRTCWFLRPVQAAIEPGSTIKPFVAAAGLAAGVVNQNELFDCRARGIRVAGRWIRDHADPDYYTIDGIIAHSSNTGVVELAYRLDEDLLWRTYDGLGFGRRAELGFPGESAGLLWPVSRWTKMSRAGLALGQEITVTPLQLALAYAVFANGGWLPEPRLVDRLGGGDAAPSDRVRHRTRVMDERLTRRMTEMLEAVVTEGTGLEAAISGYRVAGKTGTAQNSVDGAFDDKHHTAWFAGYLPLPDPRWVIVVAIENPRTTFWASSTAAPLFARVAESVVRLEAVAPTASDVTHVSAEKVQERPGVQDAHEG